MLEEMNSTTFTDPQNIIFNDNIKDPINLIKCRSEFDSGDNIAMDFILATISHL